MATRAADGGGRYRTVSLVILAVLGTVAALYFMRAILIPVTLAVVLACLLSPATTFLRRLVPLGPTGAAVVLFLLALLLGLYLTSLTAESLVQATTSLPQDIAACPAGRAGRSRTSLRDKPFLRFLLPAPRTIDKLGYRNSELLYDSLTYGLADLSGWVAQGLIVLILVLFLLAESEMLTSKVVRFFARNPGDAAAAEQTLKDLTRQIRSFLLARTLINLALGLVFAFFLWRFKVRFPFLLGLFAGLTNFVPYVGQVLGGGLACLVTLAQFESLGDALIVASVYLGLVTVEGYVGHALRPGPLARPERYGHPDRVPVLGVPLGPGRPDPGHADHRLHQAGLPEHPRIAPLGRPDEPRLAASAGGQGRT